MKTQTFINSQTTPVVKPLSDTSCNMRKSLTASHVDKLRTNMIAVKSFFMNEIYYLRQEISSLQLKLQQKTLNLSGNNKVCGQHEKMIIENLKTKLDIYQRENQLLKDKTIAKQRTIESILYQNNELFKLDRYYNKDIEKKPSLARLKKK